MLIEAHKIVVLASDRLAWLALVRLKTSNKHALQFDIFFFIK